MGSDHGAVRKNIGSSKEPKKKHKLHPGRHGDPRMRRAVQARVDNPAMSLLAALVTGGFVFPDLENSNLKMSEVKDTEGVSVYQRRNQLIRRIRLAKKGNEKAGNDNGN